MIKKKWMAACAMGAMSLQMVPLAFAAGDMTSGAATRAELRAEGRAAGAQEDADMEASFSMTTEDSRFAGTSCDGLVGRLYAECVNANGNVRSRRSDDTVQISQASNRLTVTEPSRQADMGADAATALGADMDAAPLSVDADWWNMQCQLFFQSALCARMNAASTGALTAAEEEEFYDMFDALLIMLHRVSQRLSRSPGGAGAMEATGGLVRGFTDQYPWLMEGNDRMQGSGSAAIPESISDTYRDINWGDYSVATDRSALMRDAWDQCADRLPRTRTQCIDDFMATHDVSIDTSADVRGFSEAGRDDSFGTGAGEGELNPAGLQI